MGHNLLTWAITAIVINLVIGIYSVALPTLVDTPYNQLTQTQIDNIATQQKTQAAQWNLDTGICRTGDTTCTNELTQQTTPSTTVQDPLSTFFNIFGYFGKALQIIAAIPLVGIYIGILAGTTPLTTLNILIWTLALLWNLTTIYLVLKLFMGTTRIW